jgi:hypothetical protein
VTEHLSFTFFLDKKSKAKILGICLRAGRDANISLFAHQAAKIGVAK